MVEDTQPRKIPELVGPGEIPESVRGKELFVPRLPY